MAKLTRDEIISRALIAYDKAGYYYGGDYLYSGSDGVHVKFVGFDEAGKGKGVGYDGRDYPVTPCPASESPYIACDCAAFTGWCWGVNPAEVWSGDFYTGGRFGDNYRSGLEGIQKGDVLYTDGHVALYCGDYTLELSNGNWPNTDNGHGGNRRKSSERAPMFWGYCSYDQSYSSDYDEETQSPDDFVSDGTAYQGGNPHNPYTTDFSPSGGYDSYWSAFNRQYTKRYILMKPYRRF